MQAHENIFVSSHRIRPYTPNRDDNVSDGAGGGAIELINPYDPSISLQIQNRRRQTINSVEDITAPYSPTLRSNRTSFERERSARPSLSMERFQGDGRPSMESVRPSSGIQRSYGFGPLESSQPIGETVEIQRPDRQNELLRRMSQFRPGPARRNAVNVTNDQTTENDLEVRAVVLDDTRDTHFPARIFPVAQDEETGRIQRSFSARSLLSGHRRSISPISNYRRHRNQRRMPSFLSELFPVGVAIEGSPHSTLQHSTLLGSQNIPLRVYINLFFTFILPQQIYLHLLLRLPYLYYSRVTQIFLDANLTLDQMTKMTLWDSVDGQPRSPPNPQLARAYSRLKQNWEGFIDNVLREWKTLNITSGLLLSGILTIFQIDGANSDAITRYMAFWSLISALLSLMYGCFFIIRFSNMRKVYKATEWAIEAQRNQTLFWNVWVMLAMPAIWLVWSMIAYIVCIMAFMWRVRPNDPNSNVSPRISSAADQGFRIFICCVLGVGILYAILIINTLRRYGSQMDRTWSLRITGFRKQQATSIHSLEEPNLPVQSPPIQVGDIVPPTPPQHYAQLMLSSSPPTPSTPPFIPPRPPPVSPLAERRPDPPLQWQVLRRQSLNRSTWGTPLFSSSRHRLSPDAGSEFEVEPPRSPSITGSPRMMPQRGDALGLILSEDHYEHGAVPGSPDSPTDHEHTIHIVREGTGSEHGRSESHIEVAGSTTVSERDDEYGGVDFLRVEREESEATFILEP